MILSLQGCMAVGKTTALRYLQEHAPYLHVNWEERGKVIREVGRRGLRKDVYEDYVEIQRLWLRNEATRHKKALAHPNTVMDFGAGEIEFYTLNYPASIGANWEVEKPLAEELAAAQASACRHGFGAVGRMPTKCDGFGVFGTPPMAVEARLARQEPPRGAKKARRTRPFVASRVIGGTR